MKGENILRRIEDSTSPSEVKGMYESGMTIKKIGEELGFHQETVRRFMEKKGIPRRKGTPRAFKGNPPTKGELKELYWEEKLSTYQIADRFEVSSSTIRYWLKKYGIPVRVRGTEKSEGSVWSEEETKILTKAWPVKSRREIQKLLPNRSWTAIKSKASKLRINRLYHRVFVKKEPSKQLSYVLGVMLGDGTIGTGCVQLEVKDKEFADAFKSSLEEIGCKPSCYETRGGRYYRVRGYSKDLTDWIEEMSLDEKFEIGKEYSAEFLRGIFDSDGSLSYDSSAKFWRLRISSTDYELVNRIVELLGDLDFKTSLVQQDQRGDEHTSLGKRFVFKKVLWHINILGGSEGVRRFIRMIRPSIRRKRRILEYS